MSAPSRPRRVALWLASLAGAAVLLWLAAQRVDLWPRTLHLPRPDLLALAAVLHVPYSLARSLRLRYALDPRVRAATGDPTARVPPDLLYGSGLLANLIILLLPLRLGELTRPLLLARAGVPGVGLPEAIAGAAGERVLDGLIVVGLLLVGLAYATHLGPGFLASSQSALQVGRGMGLVFVAMLVGLAGLALAPSRLLDRFVAALPARLARFVGQLAATLRDLSRPRSGLPLVLWSLVYWALTVVQSWLVLRACGLGLGLAEAAAVVAVVGLSIQLPGGPAQVGSYQVGGAVAMTLFLPVEDLQGPGSSFVAVSYLLGLLGAAALALPGAWLMARAMARAAATSPARPAGP